MRLLKNRLNIYIVSAYHIPDNAAQANRILSYANGIHQLRHSVTILQIIPFDLASGNKLNDHVDGVPVIYFSKSENNNIFYYKLLSIIGLFKSMFYLIKKSRSEKIDVIILQSENVIDRILYFFVKKFTGSILIADISEYPYFLFKEYTNLIKRINAYLRFYLDLHIYDGVYFISSFIKQYFLRYNKHIISRIIPITVDTERFKENKMPAVTLKEPYLAFCGNLYGEKDGVGILIDAFNQIHLEFPEFNLVLIGDNSDKKKLHTILSKIETHGLSENVIFTGMIHRDKIPALLSNATLLLLARPGNKQAEGGFPTKLGEYLATGHPVVVTKVGDIPEYIVDGINGFLAEPGNAQSFAMKTIEALSDVNHLKKVGYEGFKLAKEQFDYKVIALKMVEFMSELLDKRNSD
jgi:glycosyltransferase involved in cell wall biosynthesis